MPCKTSPASTPRKYLRKWASRAARVRACGSLVRSLACSLALSLAVTCIGIAFSRSHNRRTEIRRFRARLRRRPTNYPLRPILNPRWRTSSPCLLSHGPVLYIVNPSPDTGRRYLPSDRENATRVSPDRHTCQWIVFGIAVRRVQFSSFISRRALTFRMICGSFEE